MATKTDPFPLYVLADRAAFLFMPEHSGEVVELHTALCGEKEYFSFFLSPLDAALCCEYLNRQEHNGARNSYEVRSLNDSAVRKCVLRYGLERQMVGTVVMGFAVGRAHKLVINNALYSLVHMPLSHRDMNWIFCPSKHPFHRLLAALPSSWQRLLHGQEKPTIFASVRAKLDEQGAGDHLDDVRTLADLPAASQTKLAAVALAKIGVRATADEGGFAVFSPSRQAWRFLVEA